MKYVLTLAAVLALSSCEAPGYRAAQERVIRPAEVASFDVLYAKNCSACHGAKGEGALTVGIGSPVYLAIAQDSTIRDTIRKGRRGTPMSAFAQSEGGMLTDAQIEILVARNSPARVSGHRERESTALRIEAARRYGARQTGVHGVLCEVSWRGQYRRPFLSFAGHRSAPAHGDYRRHAESWYARLARV